MFNELRDKEVDILPLFFLRREDLNTPNLLLHTFNELGIPSNSLFEILIKDIISILIIH